MRPFAHYCTTNRNNMLLFRRMNISKEKFSFSSMNNGSKENNIERAQLWLATTFFSKSSKQGSRGMLILKSAENCQSHRCEPESCCPSRSSCSCSGQFVFHKKARLATPPPSPPPPNPSSFRTLMHCYPAFLRTWVRIYVYYGLGCDQKQISELKQFTLMIFLRLLRFESRSAFLGSCIYAHIRVCEFFR